MFTFEEFKVALEAFEKETSRPKSDSFTELKREQDFFSDVRSREEMEKQINEFINIISSMDRDRYASRYVVQTFLLEFYRFLDKDFLFYITDHSTFLKLRQAIKEFTGGVYESHKKFTQNISLHSLEHLLEDYALLLKFSDRGFESSRENKEEGEGFSSFWKGGNLW